MRGKDERRDTGTGWPERAGRDRPDEPATVAGAGIEPDVEVEPAADLEPPTERELVPAAEPETEPATESAAEPTGVDEPGREPVRARRVSAAGAAIGLLLGLLGFALVVHLRSKPADAGLSA